MGWYHSHPFDVEVHSHCFLSATDVSTQLAWQRHVDAKGDPWLAIVVCFRQIIHSFGFCAQTNVRPPFHIFGRWTHSVHWPRIAQNSEPFGYILQSLMRRRMRHQTARLYLMMLLG